MKLKIKGVTEVVREEDKEVTLSLYQDGDSIDLIVQKEGKANQVALKFFPMEPFRELLFMRILDLR